jgi:hypothetical protein
MAEKNSSVEADLSSIAHDSCLSLLWCCMADGVRLSSIPFPCRVG